MQVSEKAGAGRNHAIGGDLDQSLIQKFAAPGIQVI